MFKFKGELHKKITRLTFLIVVLPLLLLGSYSYIKSSQIIKSRISDSNLKTVEQTGQRIENVLNQIHQNSLDMIRDQTVRQYLNMEEENISDKFLDEAFELSTYLTDLTHFKDNIYSISLDGNNGIKLDSKNSYYEFTEQDKSILMELNGGATWSYETLGHFNGSKIEVVSLSRMLKDYKNLSCDLGFFRINVKRSVLTDMLGDQTAEKDYFYLIDNNSRVIATNNDSSNDVIKRLSLTNSKKKSGYFESDDELVTYYKFDKVDWILVHKIPIASLVKDNKIILKYTLGSIIICVIVIELLMSLVYLRIFEPLKQVRKIMREVENENFDITMDVKGDDEIALVGESLNQMSQRLKVVKTQVYESTIKQRESELKALQAQINPHFLYNTLDTIYWMALGESAEQTSELVHALSSMFRLSLNDGKGETTVEEEMMHLENYIYILTVRYGETIDFSVETSKEVLSLKVIKQVIQPLVENAVYHGIEKNGGTGSIRIKAYVKNNSLIYEIIDDGIGVDAESLNACLNSDHTSDNIFAIQNVNERIKLYSGNEYGIKYDNEVVVGTRVIVRQRMII